MSCWTNYPTDPEITWGVNSYVQGCTTVIQYKLDAHQGSDFTLTNSFAQYNQAVRRCFIKGFDCWTGFIPPNPAGGDPPDEITDSMRSAVEMVFWAALNENGGSSNHPANEFLPLQRIRARRLGPYFYEVLLIYQATVGSLPPTDDFVLVEFRTLDERYKIPVYRSVFLVNDDPSSATSLYDAFGLPAGDMLVSMGQSPYEILNPNNTPQPGWYAGGAVEMRVRYIFDPWTNFDAVAFSQYVDTVTLQQLNFAGLPQINTYNFPAGTLCLKGYTSRVYTANQGQEILQAVDFVFWVRTLGWAQHEPVFVPGFYPPWVGAGPVQEEQGSWSTNTVPAFQHVAGWPFPLAPP